MRMEKSAVNYHRLGLVNYLAPFTTSPLFHLLVLSFSGAVEGYKNYTVGDSSGWYDTVEKPDVDYQKWAASNNFSLGEFLIFNTDSNHSVIQTYNFTTYKVQGLRLQGCLRQRHRSVVICRSIVHLPVSNFCGSSTSQTVTYFFSGDYDGEQCQNGQHFNINMTYGQGLPPGLRSPSDSSPALALSRESGDDQSVPDILAPYNFDDPKDTNDSGVQPSKSVSLFQFSRLFGVQLYGLLVLVEFLCRVC